MMSKSLAVGFWLGIVVGLAGCGGSTNTVWVKGVLLKGGAPYVPPQGHQVTITLVGIEIEDGSGQSRKQPEPFVADLDDARAIFTVPGRDGAGIPPGRYRVAVTQKMTREAFDLAKPKSQPGQPKVTRETDFLDSKFSEDRSPIVRRIKAATNLTIDLDKPNEG